MMLFERTRITESHFRSAVVLAYEGVQLNTLMADLFQCSCVADGVRCIGRLSMRENQLICEKCSTVFQIVNGKIPFLRDDDKAVDANWYDHNYDYRSRAQDMVENVDCPARKVVADEVRKHHVQGPSLDVGCGTGLYADLLPGFIGMDYALAGITSAGTEEFSYVCGTAERIPFRDEMFGCVLSTDALEHVPRVDTTFLEMHRVLKPGGFVILKPAWHCTRYQTELLSIKSYRELKTGQKLTKALLPVLTSKPWKFLKHVPWRLWRRLFAARPTKLAFTPLTPNYSQWIADSDAAASIDCHEGILFFESRGYTCFSHPTVKQRLLAGHDWIVLQKPMQ